MLIHVCVAKLKIKCSAENSMASQGKNCPMFIIL
jgi:hypothetical protein